MAEKFKASTRIKRGTWKEKDDRAEGDDYVEVGDPVKKSDFEDWDDLVAAKAVLPEEEFDRVHPELVLGVNQASGTPSNLLQVEGTQLQVNLPEPTPDDKKAAEPPAPRNPADPPKVEGAVEPGSGEDSHGQDVDLPEDDENK